MNMNRISSLGLLAITAAVGAAHAEVQAKFHLPVQARWGKMTLAPGDYKVSLPQASLGNRQFIVAGDRMTGVIQPLVTDEDRGTTPNSSASYLQLVNVDGTYFIAQYRSGASGKTFSFAVPKPKHRLEIVGPESVRVGVGVN
jgi:hypothetical protein